MSPSPLSVALNAASTAMVKDAIYDRLRLSISDLHEAKRISAVEMRALMELSHDLMKDIKGNRLPTQVELDNAKSLSDARGREIDRLQQGLAIRDSEVRQKVEQLAQKEVEINKLREESKTLGMVQHTLGAAPTREHILCLLDQLKSTLAYERTRITAQEEVLAWKEAELVRLRQELPERMYHVVQDYTGPTAGYSQAGAFTDDIRIWGKWSLNESCALLRQLTSKGYTVGLREARP